MPLLTTGAGAYVVAAGVASSTWNPSDLTSGASLSNANLTFTAGTTFGIYYGVRSTTSKSTGKWYFEVTVSTAGAATYIGIANALFDITALPGNSDANASSYSNDGTLYANSGGTAIAASTYTTANIIGVAVDVPNHLIWWSKNGVYQNSGNPAAGTNGVNYITTAAIFACVVSRYTSTSGVHVANFGATAFNTAAPSGFTAWG